MGGRATGQSEGKLKGAEGRAPDDSADAYCANRTGAGSNAQKADGEYRQRIDVGTEEQEAKPAHPKH